MLCRLPAPILCEPSPATTRPDEDVYEALKRAVDPLTDVWERLRKAKRIGLKINQDKPRDRWVFYDGQLQQLVSSKVLRRAAPAA